MQVLPIVVVAWYAASPVGAQDPNTIVESTLRDLERRGIQVPVTRLDGAPGETRMAPADSVTVETLRDGELDDDPPVLGTPAQPHPVEHADGFPAGEAPYYARGIRPFRLRHFTAEFNYGGWHNFGMMEYAATHGFSVIYPYVMEDVSHFPAGTKWLRWGSFVNWQEFFQAHGIPWGRYDRLADLDVTGELLNSADVWQPAPNWISMVDLEHGAPLSPEELRAQEYYPAAGAEADRVAFEKQYYAGYLKTYTAPIEALRQKGWRNVGIYPQPYGSGWFALLGLADSGRTGLPVPDTHWPWVEYGRAMHDAQDVLYPDIYVYYWSPRNVAYTLARIDFDVDLVKSADAPRPYRPYFWPLLHGGDADPHWWAQQPLPTEDMRAMYVFPFFSGCDGVVLWNWSGTGNHHQPAPLWQSGQTSAVGEHEVEGGVGADVMVGEPFELRPAGAAPDTEPTPFDRYDVLAVLEVQGDSVRFQHIDTSQQAYGDRLDPNKPVYVMDRNELIRHLRAPSEAVAGAVEGLALVKAFEPILRRGEVKVDVPSLDQFSQTLPIVRRVTLGGYHLIATYDPQRVQGQEPREIVLHDFGGQAGRTVVLPADSETRVFVVREADR